MREQVRAQVHRFHDCVAVYVGTGETVYLAPKDARKLSRAINKAARSVERERFADSEGLTFELDAPDGRDVVFVRIAPPPLLKSDLAVRNELRLSHVRHSV